MMRITKEEYELIMSVARLGAEVLKDEESKENLELVDSLVTNRDRRF